jgi:hypothetical protein
MPSDEITGSPEESSPPWTDEKKDAGISMRVEPSLKKAFER